MVSISTMIAVCVTLFISMVLPVILYIVYGVKNKGEGVWSGWLMGAAGFFVMQYSLRTPLIVLLPTIPGFMELAEKYYLLYCFVLAFSAGLFEMFGRLFVAKLAEKSLTFKRGFAMGMGHGSIEAILLIGMTYVNNLLYSIAINNGTFDSMIEQVVAAGQDASMLYDVREALINTFPGVFYLAGYERILTFVFHIALSLIVCYFVWRKKTAIGLIICLTAHTAVDFITGALNGMSTEYLGNVVSEKVGYILIYLFLTLVAVGSGYVIRQIYRMWKVETE